MSIGVLLGKQLAKVIKGTGDDVADETVEALGKTSAKPERFDPEALKSAANQNDKSREILVDTPIEDFLRVSEKVSPDEENIRSLVQRPIKDPVIKTPKIPESLKKFVKDGYYTDKNTGEPKKLYHGLGGTLRGEATNFEGINLRTTDSGTLGEGVYLSTDPKVGSDFAMDLRAGREEARMGGQVIPVYVKTPYIADSNLINNNDPWRDWLIKLYDSYFDKKRGRVSNIGKLKNKKLDFDHYLAKDVFNGEEEARHLEKMYNKLHDKKDINLGDFFTYQPKGSKGTNEIDFGKYIRKQLENSAIGGITINSAKGFSETVIFNPKDIKSALQGSKGKYDPDNPDMLLNTGGLVERPNK